MGRDARHHGIRELLYRNLEHPRWDEVAERCLTCGNCTMVCPTCFCTTVEDVTDLAGDEAERVRRWDSCFTLDYSYVHGGSVRPSARSRYRQWMTHKLATWIDQFGIGLRRLRALHHLVPGGDRHHRGGGRDPRRPRRLEPMKTIDELLAEVPTASRGSSRAARADRRLRDERALRRGRVPVPRGRAGRHLLRRSATARVALEIFVPGARRR